MYNFKEFFKRNYDSPILLEAFRGSYPKKPVLYDNEDLDFLYQFDQRDWINALNYRYKSAWAALKKRQDVRNKIIKEMISSLKKSEFIKPVSIKMKQGDKEETRTSYKIYVNKMNIEQFKKFILDLGEVYDNYGDKTGEVDTKELSQRKYWLDQLFDEYDIETIYTRGAKDNQRAIKDIIFEIIKRIVIYVKGGDEETYPVARSNMKAKLYLNRFIQKLETTKGEEHHLKTRLENLSEIYGKDIQFGKIGSYGFDLSNPRVVKKTIKSKNGKVKKEIVYRTGSGAEGYTFPKSTSIRDSLHRLYSLNYHRHFGDLPTDDPSHTHDIIYKSIESKMSGASTSDDKLSFNVLKTSIANNIRKSLIKKRSGDWYSTDLEDLLKGSFNPDDEKEKMISGIWFVRKMLDNESAKEEDVVKIPQSKLRSIFHSPPDLYDVGVERNKEDGKIGIKALRWMTSYQNVVNVRKLRDMFAEYFANLRVLEYINSQAAYSPRILGIDPTGDPKKDEEIRIKELARLDKQDLAMLQKNLTPEEWEKFKKTGRLPYKIGKDREGKTVVKVGEDSPPLILPHIKKGEGKSAIYFPLLKPGKYVKQFGDSAEEYRDIEKLKNRIQKNLYDFEIKDADSYDLDSVDDLEKLSEVLASNNLERFNNQVKKLIEKLKEKESLAKKIITTSRSSSIITPSGEEIPIVKFIKTKQYQHGEKGTVLPGARPVDTSTVPGAVAKKSKKIALAKIFPTDRPVMGPDGPLVDEKVWNFFKVNPKEFPSNARPMKFLGYKISNSLEGTVDSSNVDNSRRDIGESFWQEKIDLGKFLLIKEEEEEKRPKKTTEKYNKVIGNIWWEIEKSDAPNIEGYDDIVMGIKNFLFFGKHGGIDVQPVVKNYYLQIENFQNLHDQIVKEFWENAEDIKLHYSKTRREYASKIVNRLTQKENPEIEGSVARKMRTGVDFLGTSPKIKPIIDSDINLDDIKPLNVEENKETLQDIFIDYEHPFKIKDESGIPKTWLIMKKPGGPSNPFSFRGQPVLAGKEIDGPNFYEYLIVRSKILSFTRGNVSRIDRYNFSKVKELLNQEYNNLLNYWNKIFNLLQSSKINESTPEAVKQYFKGSYDNTVESLKNIYKQEITAAENQVKASLKTKTKEPIGKEAVMNDVSGGILDIQDIIRDIKELTESIPNFSIKAHPPSRPGDHPSRASIIPILKLHGANIEQSGRIQIDRDTPEIITWFKTIISLLKSFHHVVTNEPNNPSFLTFIATQKGGLSSRTGDLRYPVHVILNRIDDNIKKFLKVLSDNIKQNPNYIDELSTNNKSKIRELDAKKNEIKSVSPHLSDIINKIKAQLIQNLRK